jgi:hypothetical protein
MRSRKQNSAVRYYRQTIFSVRNVVVVTLIPPLLSSIHRGQSSLVLFLAFVLLLGVTRHYSPRISNKRVPANLVLTLWVTEGALWAYFREGQSLWILFFVLLVLMSFAGLTKLIHRSCYWQIQEGCVIQRHYFRRIVFPFSEITYVGPMTDVAGLYEYFAEHILIENISGEQIVVNTPQREAFWAEMNKHLPLITRNLVGA